MTISAPLFAVTSPERAAKGRRWMRALQRQVADVWRATIETDTAMCRCHGLVAEAEVVAISAAFAVTATRVLDLEVFQKEDQNGYLAAKAADRLGLVVDGLVLIRNAEIHLPVILEPDADRVLSLNSGERGQHFRVIPNWKPYPELPATIRDSTGTNQRCHLAYQTSVAGESIIETLLDALAWFLRCDPSLARRDAGGELEHFPLPELWPHDYERRHPEWKRRQEVEAEVRAEAEARRPSDQYRTIRHRLVDDGGNILAYCGSARGTSGEARFTETPDQVERDVGRGHPYFAEYVTATNAEGVATALRGTRVALVDGVLASEDGPLADMDFVAFGESDPEPIWRGSFELVRQDAFKYVQQRSAAG